VGDGFSVDPQALNGLAGEFEHAAGRLAGVVGRFSAAAQPGSDAFGLLPQARAAHVRYVTKAGEGLDGLKAVRAALADSLAGGLRAAAGTYVRADEGGVAAAG
jgi:hypothetical protein